MTFVTRTISALRTIFMPVGLAKAILSVAILMITFSLPVFSQNTVVSNVVAQQRPGTGLVDITYDVTSIKATVAISLRVSSDGGATFIVPASSLTGDLGTAIRIGKGKRITWDAGADWPEKWSDAMRFEISADDGIITPPTITTQPATQNNTGGTTATLAVTVSGSIPITYQWYQGEVGTTTTPVGTNAASFTTPALTDTTSYWVRVSNSAGSVNSSGAAIYCSPTITTQPASQTITSGNTATLTVTALGPATLTYQWYRGFVGNTILPVGTNSASFTTPALTNTSSYWVRVSNSIGNVNSALATISCSPAITTQPASQTITSGNTATLTVTASGATPLTYQWYRFAIFPEAPTPVGTNSATFTTPALTNQTSYFVRVSNTAGSVDSEYATITCSPNITTQPASQTITSGNTATLKVVASESSPLTYQWYQGAVGTTSVPVGTNSSSFKTPALSDTTSYWVRVSNAFESVNSALATITCSPAITTQPASQTIAAGGIATLTVVASGSSPLTYQWYQGAVGTTTTPVGTNAASYTTPALTATTSFWVRVSNSVGSVNSNVAILTVIGVSADHALIPAGSFQMGVTSGDTDSDAPSVSVNESDFYIGKREVTMALWDEVRTWAAANGYTDLAQGVGKATNHPVQSVRWWDVVKWCNARSQKEGLTPCYTVSGAVMKTGYTAPAVNWSANGYRLPTEAEWEKAARGGESGKRFPWGNDTISHSMANFDNRSGEAYSIGTFGYHPTYATASQPHTSPVGSFNSNGFGLADMAGNVYEWCWDWHGVSTYVNGATDPTGAASGTGRVVRGGGWGSTAIRCRAAERSSSIPSVTSNMIGFRVARSSGL